MFPVIIFLLNLIHFSPICPSYGPLFGTSHDFFPLTYQDQRRSKTNTNESHNTRVIQSWHNPGLAQEFLQEKIHVLFTWKLHLERHEQQQQPSSSLRVAISASWKV